ncbi:MAG: hypothetical protein HWQ38_24055 [Nostoc sp. NMS7]|uniref:ADP-ribosyltransferase domain-containing protein n=1 Tax=Nostoc sp. NMS7 TaxID=2815391 RepID=UPI0025D4FDC6|nr:ADP-ribosyltransferase domain-containing protein [Nostoc sp. NMS7]MBN3949367.1 hypothetical protein [Nostoc sp. NMS7]
MNFDETGDQIKQILEKRYTDGISGLEGVKVVRGASRREGSKIIGVFSDIVSPVLTKKFNFSIDSDTGDVDYTQIDTGNLEQNFSEYEFAAPGSKSKQCKEGKSSACTRADSSTYCIKVGYKCKSVGLSGEEKAVVKAIVEKTTKQPPQKPLSEKPPKASKSKKEPVLSLQSQPDAYGGKQRQSSTTEIERKEYRGEVQKSTLDRAKKNLKKIPNSPPPYPEELAGVESYSSAFYGQMNDSLRNGSDALKPNIRKIVESHIKMTNAALENMPKYEGSVYRGAMLPNEVLSQYKVGNTVKEKAFVSTTTNKEVASDFASTDSTVEGYTPVLYEIKSKKGVSIKDFSIIPKEDEVLFKSGSSFKVSKIEKKNGQVKIYMDEA